MTINNEKNKIIFDALDILECLSKELHLDYQKDDKYHSILKLGKSFCYENDIKLSHKIKVDIIKLINNMQIKNQDAAIGRFVYYQSFNNNLKELEKAKLNMNEQETIPVKIETLNDKLLSLFVINVLKTISYNIHPEYTNLVLLKYGKSLSTIGFNKLAEVCRGKIVDTKNKTIVSYPLDKFYNVNENDKNSFETISNLINESDYSSCTDKRDGSTLILTLDSDYGLLINTNGSFHSEQVKKGMALLNTQYSYFLENIKTGFTYIFEITYPENRIVLDYGIEECLTLIGIRSLATQRLLNHLCLVKLAEFYHLPIVESEEFYSLEGLLHLAETWKNANKEGWVLLIEKDGIQHMVKIKLNEYVELHRSILGNISLARVYQLIKENTIDDVIAKNHGAFKEALLLKVALVYDYLELLEQLLKNTCNELNNEFGFSQEDVISIKKDREHKDFREVIAFIKEISKRNNCSWMGKAVSAYFIYGEDYEDIIGNISFNEFKRILRDVFYLDENNEGDKNGQE